MRWERRTLIETLLSLLSVVASVAALIALPWICKWAVLSGMEWWVATLAAIGVLIILLSLAGSEASNLREDSRYKRKLRESVDEPVERASLTVTIVAVLLAAAGVTVAWLGFRYLHPEWTLKDLTTDFYANLAIDLISVGVTVLIIDRLYDRRFKLEDKQRIIEQMRSPSAEFAKEALRIVKEKGWVRDGSLKRADLKRADLTGADLEGADLEDANLWGAILRDTHLTGANLRGANLWGAILRDTHLQRADLEGAALERALLTGAHLKGATYNADTTWPKGFDPMAAGAVDTDQGE